MLPGTSLRGKLAASSVWISSFLFLVPKLQLGNQKRVL